MALDVTAATDPRPGAETAVLTIVGTLSLAAGIAIMRMRRRLVAARI